jgi:two-component system capsular synthesis response regulator RcsB
MMALERLSPVELETLKLFALGHRTRDIAAMRNRSMKTISTHKTRIMNKLHIVDNVQWMALLKEVSP